MRVYGAAAIANLLGDLVAYRNLRPIDPRLPGGSDVMRRLGIPAGQALRKGDERYARIVAAILGAARALEAPGTVVRRLVVIGDTRMSDGGAFTSLCNVAGWDGRAFIGHEKPDVAPDSRHEGGITFANRWDALHDFAAMLERDRFIDAHTAVVIDLDKTLIGARGRNDRLIDEARLAALRASVADILGPSFNAAAFEQTYRAINESRFHQLTGDNQDYVAYICVMINGGVIDLETLSDQVASGHAARFDTLLALIGQQRMPSTRIEAFHRQIARRIAAGDPTPFKAFRRREYHETAARMGCRPDETPADQLVREELVLTAEVWQVAEAWQQHGALLFGLSDKPDEAAIPEGNGLSLHRIKTHLVGWG